MNPLRFACALLLLASTWAFSQETQSQPRNEVLLFGQHSGFTDANRSPHSVATLQYYRALSPAVKLFADASATRRFDQTDASAGIGAYYIADPSNSFYGFVAAGVDPEVIPRADVTVEYTRLLLPRLAASIGYRGVAFRDETVYMAIPGVTVYAVPRWTFTGKLFCARLGTDARLRATFLLHTTFEIDERWMPELYYTVGSEAYRATSLDIVASQHSWILSIGTKVRLSEFLRLRIHAMHGVRGGAFEENGIDCALSVLW